MRLIEIFKANPNHRGAGPGGGQFTSGPGGGRSSATAKKPGKAPPLAKAPLNPAQAAKARAKLEAQGGTRGLDPNKLVPAYHYSNIQFDKYYSRATHAGGDGGAIHSLHWDAKEKPPKGYPKDWPTAPRANTGAKEGAFGSKDSYKPPMKMSDINNLHNMGEHGKFAARVIMNELYNHGRKRQGTSADSAEMYKSEKPMNDYMKKHKLSSINWEWHHMVMNSKGGSNSGKNLVLFDGGEHTLAHQLEASIAQEKTAKGISKGNMGTYATLDMAKAVRAQNNVTKQLGATAGQLRNAKFGGKPGEIRADRKKKPAEVKALEAKKLQTHRHYINIAIKAGVWKKGSGLQYNKEGVEYGGKDATSLIRGYLLKNPIEPGSFI